MPTLQIEKSRGDDGQEQIQLIEESPTNPWGDDASLAIVGQPVPRLEGVEKVTGRARYSYDIRLPGQLYARVLRSPHPHARIIKIDTSRAEALPGVRAVLSADNAPPIGWYEDSALFDRTLRFVGDEVAAVAAETEEIADDALRLIAVEYKILPFVGSMEAARQPGAPKLREDGNEANSEEYSRGDVAAGFGAADVVVAHTYTTQTALHNALEPHGCTATWEGDRLTIWSSTQSVFTVREQVARAVGLRANQVRVIKQHMGGGFGAKQIAWKHDVIALLLSRAAGRPVQLMLDRAAENLAVGNRNATVQRLRLGARRDGTLTAIEATIDLETGAYQTGGEAADVQGMYQSLYRCPNVSTKQTGWYTNLGPTVAFRGPGYVEAAFALEQAMDELARRLAIDPVALRLKNYAPTDQQREQPYTMPDGLRACYARATAAFGWEGYERPPAAGTRRRGIGMAAHNWMGGSGHPPGYAWVKLNADGSADVVTGTQDIGTGTRTGLAQVAAEELGLPLERINLLLGDTANGPYSPVSSGSATQATIGPAIQSAAIAARRQLLEVAATILELAADDLAVREGKIFVKGVAEAATTVEEVMGQIAPHMLLGQGARGANPSDKSIRAFGAQCAEIEVDTATGEITVLRVVSADDCGRIINPKTVASQVIGGVTQGVGYALTEGRVVDGRTGIVLNPNLEEYHVPTVADLPAIEAVRVDLADPAANPTGAKGIGESPLIPTAPAIANALYDAIGVRIHALPLTRDRVLAALAAQREPETKSGGTARG